MQIAQHLKCIPPQSYEVSSLPARSSDAKSLEQVAVQLRCESSPHMVTDYCLHLTNVLYVGFNKEM